MEQYLAAEKGRLGAPVIAVNCVWVLLGRQMTTANVELKGS